MSASSSATSVYRVDRFSVPHAATAAFLLRLRSIQQMLEDQPGCLQNLVLAAAAESGSATREFATVVEWENDGAFAAARVAVQRRYADEGFDPAAFMRALGVVPSLGVFRVLAP